MIEKLILVGLGGALGACLRFLSVGWFARVTGESAYGTLFVNVAGSFAMGMIAVLLLERLPEEWDRLAPFLMAGFLGAFTTFSAFSLDTLRMIEADRVGFAAAYVSGSVVLSVLGLFAGVALARAVVS